MKSAVGMIGVLTFGIGASLMGYCSDTYGRKLTILISIVGCVSFNLLSAFSTSYLMYIVCYLTAGQYTHCILKSSINLNLLKGIFINGVYLGPFVLCVELVGSEYAGKTSALINLPFVFGELVMIVLAYFFRDYTDLILAAFVPAYLAILILFFVPESPRWLLVNGK